MKTNTEVQGPRRDQITTDEESASRRREAAPDSPARYAGQAEEPSWALAKTGPSLPGGFVWAWLCVLSAAAPGAAFGQANYATPYTFSTIAGRAGGAGGADGAGSAARFKDPAGLRVDGAGNIYVADQNNHTIRKVALVGTNWVVTTLAGLAGVSGDADGTNSAARFYNPDCAAPDSAGNLYVADALNHTIRKMTPAGTNWVVTTVAGKAGVAGEVDGTNGTARFNAPVDIAIDGAGNLYVPDEFGDTIRKVAPVGTNWVVTTLAGRAGVSGARDGTNTAALFNAPESVAVDGAGNVYVGDFFSCAIRKVAPVGTNWVVTTLAGSAGHPGRTDGVGQAARFSGPDGVAIDSAGNLYVSDTATNNANNTIRKMTPVGTNWVVTTLAGLAGESGGADGTGSAARFYVPADLAVDGAGNLFVADAGNNTIRKGYPELTLTTSGPGFGLDGGQFDFAIYGLGGETVVVDASPDLATWTPVWTNTLTFPAPVGFADSNASASLRFYRARTP